MNHTEKPFVLRIPVSRLLQDAHDLWYSGTQDRAELEPFGIDWAMVERIPELVKMCSDAEAQWQMYRIDYSIENAKIREKLKNGWQVRAELTEYIRYAFKLEKIAVTLPLVRSNRSDSGLMQDLNDLAVIARENWEIVQKSGLSMALVDQAAELSVSLACISAEHAANVPKLSEQKKKRDMLLREIVQCVDTIRQTARLAFRTAPDRIIPYRNHYRNNLLARAVH